MFTEAHGEILLAIARAAIARTLGLSDPADETAAWLREPGACFVTLTRDDALRGCIGSLEAYRPLIEDIKANAVAAALRDPRFPPLTAAELECVSIEVSLLSPLEPIAYASETEALSLLRPGVDGVVLRYGDTYRGTFLPQVWQQLAEPAAFLGHLKIKAGLAADFWAPTVELSRYTVTKWKEQEYECTPPHP